MQTFLHSTASNRMTKMISICRDCWSRDLNPLGTLISALQCHDKSDTSGCCTSLYLTFSSTSVWLASIPHHAAKARTSALDCGNFSQHVRRLCNERTAFAQVKQQEEWNLHTRINFISPIWYPQHGQHGSMVSAQLLASITCGRASWILRQVLWSCSWSPESGQAGHGTWRSIQRHKCHNVCSWGTWNVIGLLPPHSEMHKSKRIWIRVSSIFIMHLWSLIHFAVCQV